MPDQLAVSATAKAAATSQLIGPVIAIAGSSSQRITPKIQPPKISSTQHVLRRRGAAAAALATVRSPRRKASRSP